MELKPIKVKADIMWANTAERNVKSGKYQVDLCNLSKNAIQALEDMGISVRTNPKYDDKGFFVTAKSANYPIPVVDENGAPINVKIGNGSKGVALIKPYQYNNAGNKGIGAGINKLIVTDLIEYTKDEPAEDLTEAL